LARVLTNSHYAGTFNTPRASRHTLIPVKFPGHVRALWLPLEAIAVWNPLERYDLIHSFNKIPVATRVPWVVTFESALPRTIGPREELLRRPLRERLLSDNCRKLIALSEFGRRVFMRQNEGWRGLDATLAKTEVIHPNIPLQVTEPRCYDGGELSLVFVGSDFARKGGVVAVRLAKKALERGIPLRVHIVSNLVYGGSKYSDHPDKAKYLPDLKLLELPNVTHHGGLSNAAVLDLMRQSHIHLLPTIHDTYGYSVVEGFSVGTPAFATATCALPEIVRSGDNGFLLDLPVDERGVWIHLEQRERSGFWDRLNETYESLADQCLDRVMQLMNDPPLFRRLSQGAIDQILRQHEADAVGSRLDDLYDECLA
jgi:glycosyltransferase involved in cell wall biosynthesis